MIYYDTQLNWTQFDWNLFKSNSIPIWSAFNYYWMQFNFIYLKISFFFFAWKTSEYLFESPINQLNLLACELGRLLQCLQLFGPIADRREERIVQILLCINQTQFNLISITSTLTWKQLPIQRNPFPTPLCFPFNMQMICKWTHRWARSSCSSWEAWRSG